MKNLPAGTSQPDCQPGVLAEERGLDRVKELATSETCGSKAVPARCLKEDELVLDAGNYPKFNLAANPPLGGIGEICGYPLDLLCGLGKLVTRLAGLGGFGRGEKGATSREMSEACRRRRSTGA